MASLNLEDMQQIQKELQAKYLEKWGGLSPKIGRDKLLWMMIEAGEVADIIKKKAIMIDEIWQLVGATSNRLAAEFCLTIFKTIRGFGGIAVSLSAISAVVMKLMGIL